jgi:hypothetical protein
MILMQMTSAKNFLCGRFRSSIGNETVALLGTFLLPAGGVLYILQKSVCYVRLQDVLHLWKYGPYVPIFAFRRICTGSTISSSSVFE